jgi:hypothetical protein
MDKIKTKNKDRGAFACIDNEYLQEGLTKREHIASKVLPSVIEKYSKGAFTEADEHVVDIAKVTLMYTDALLTALENEV